MTKPNVRFDYDNQAWIRDGYYIACSHPDDMDCKCYGKIHAGELAPTPKPETPDAAFRDEAGNSNHLRVVAVLGYVREDYFSEVTDGGRYLLSSADLRSGKQYATYLDAINAAMLEHGSDIVTMCWRDDELFICKR